MADFSPYPGLRPFQLEEADLFFGREEQVVDLLRRLQGTRFLAVVGASGCGKSSLVRAGMIAALETGYMTTAGSRWQFADMRPGRRPMRRLASALFDRAMIRPAEAGRDDALGFLGATLRRGPRGLLEVLNETPLPEGCNLLILVDQFEEIFRFRREGDRDEADAFVSLLLESAAQRDVPVYVVITMRSDFFGDCAVFAGLPEALNRSQYLTPRLSREQRQAAIVGPARVFGGDVEPALVARLLNDAGSDPDQLPVLQHLLMRMWTHRSGEGASPPPALQQGALQQGAVQRGEEAEQEPLPRVLSLRDYEEVGGIKHALSRHADEALARLDPADRHIAEVLFRRLSERGSDQRDIRRPTPAGEIAELAGVGMEDVIRVVDAFRAPGCSFLVPAPPETIEPEKMLDIGHESLIRQWETLRKWAEVEAQSAETYAFLEETARRWERNEAALWGTPNLEMALAWRDKERPTPVWARRYGGDFRLAMRFLAASERQREAEFREGEARRERQIGRWRRVAVALGAGCVVSAVAIVAILYGWYVESERHYASFVKRWGIAEGFGALGSDQVNRREWSLKVVRQGWFGDVLYVEAVDSAGNCTHRHNIGTVLEPEPEAVSPTRECRWEFLRDAEDQIAYEKAYNKFGELVWGFLYTPVAAKPAGDPGSAGIPEHPRSRQAYFVGPDGFPQPRKNASAEVVKFAYTEEGYEAKVTYWTRKNEPARGPDRAFGQERQFGANGLVTRLTSLDENGEPMNDSVGNASLELTYDVHGNATGAEAFDRHGRETLLNLGFHRLELDYDENGNNSAVRIYGIGDLPAGASHEIVFTYDDRGHMAERAYFDRANAPSADADGIHKLVSAYDDRGNPIVESYFGTDGRPMTLRGCHRVRTDYDERDNPSRRACLDAAGQPSRFDNGAHMEVVRHDDRGLAIEQVFLDTRRRPTVSRDGSHKLKFEHNDRGHRTSTRHLDLAGNPVAVGGCHEWRARYTELGDLEEDLCFDVNGDPAMAAAGYHRKRARYDARGKLTEEIHYDTRGRLTLNASGYALYRASYDERGSAVEESFYGEDERLLLQPAGYALVRRAYDQHGRLIEQSYHGEDGSLLLQPEGFALVRTTYEEDEGVVETSYHGEDGELLMQPGGHALVRKTYDEKGRPIEEAYYDDDRRLVMQADGYASWKVEYDSRDNYRSVSYFDAAGQPANVVCHQVRMTYDENDRPISWACFDGEGQPSYLDGGHHKRAVRYDERGFEMQEAYFDVDGRPMVHAEGYHMARFAHDANGNRTATRYFGPSEDPIAIAGCHQRQEKYDGRGRVIEARCFDADGDPAVADAGYHRKTTRYDDRGNLVEEAYFHPGGGLSLQPSGYAMVRKSYDEQGHKVEEAYYGEDGELLLQATGYAMIRNVYDEEGRIVEEAYHGGDGDLLLQPDGYALLRVKYDSAGNITEFAYHGEDGALLNQPAGYAIVRWTYDDRGNRLEDTYFDREQRPVADMDGVWRTARSYDEDGRLIEQRYFGIDDRPLRRDLGIGEYVAERYVYQDGAKATAFVDEAGAAVMVQVEESDDAGTMAVTGYFAGDGTPLSSYVVVDQVFVGSPAEQAGLRPGDLLVSYAGTPIDGPQMFADLTQADGEDTRSLVVMREGRSLSLQVPAGRIGIYMQTRFAPDQKAAASQSAGP